MRRTVLAAALVAGAVLLPGCASPGYYRITNTETGRIYYAEEYKVNDTGALIFEDARTGKRVTVFNSEVEELTEDQFKNTVYRGDAAFLP